MSKAWKILLSPTFSRITIQSASRFVHLHHQVLNINPKNPRYFSSFLNQFTLHSTNDSRFSFDPNMRIPTNRSFSSEPALEQGDLDHVVITDIFSKSNGSDEIRSELESHNLVLSYDTVLTVLRNLDGNPKIAIRFFDWVSETDNAKLSSKSYNLMLRILGTKDHVKEFWDLVEIMKKKGYCVSKNAYAKVSENFAKESLASDLDVLDEVFTAKSRKNSVERLCFRVCKLIREDEWGENVRNKLVELDVSFSSNLVVMILDRLSVHPTKALMFFRWLKEDMSFTHNAGTYNAMVTVLGREDCIEEFWDVANEMKEMGFEVEMDTYVKVLGRFCKRKMMNEAVTLYEFAMDNMNKPPVHDCLILLHKIVVGKDTDMGSISRVVRASTKSGNVLKTSVFYGVVKSLVSVGKLGECGKILKAMEEGGFVPNSAVYAQAVYGLSKAGEVDDEFEFLTGMKSSRHDKEFPKAWAQLVHGYCVSGELDCASSFFKKVVEKEGVGDSGYAFQVLVNGFCDMNRAEDACKVLSEMVEGKELRPQHTTYKILIEKLLNRGSLKEALGLLGLMKCHGFPPFLDPFIAYISNCGTGDDAFNFLKAMTVNKFPSTSVVLRVFEAFFKAGRHDMAHDLLSKSPGYIRGHADVLNLFCSMKPEEAASVA